MQDNYQDNPNRKNNVRNNGGGNKTARRAAPQGTAPRQRQMQHQGEAPRRRAGQTQGEEPRRRKVQYMDEGDMQADMPMQQDAAPRRRKQYPAAPLRHSRMNEHQKRHLDYHYHAQQYIVAAPDILLRSVAIHREERHDYRQEYRQKIQKLKPARRRKDTARGGLVGSG